MPVLVLLLTLLGFQSFVAECQDIFPIKLGSGSNSIPLTLNDGSFVITWPGQSSAFLFNANGSLAKQFAVNNAKQPPSMAALADGTFIYTWSDIQNGVLQVLVQRYHQDGTPYGAQFTADSGNLTSLNELASSVTALEDGGFVIIWDGENFDGEKDENKLGWDVSQSYAQVFNSDNTPRGSQFVVYKGNSSSAQMYPIVFGQENEGFGILWNEIINFNLDKAQIYAQLYHSNGAKIGDTLVLDDTTTSQLGQAAARLKSGQIVVAWQGLDTTTHKYHVYARIINPNGKPKGQTFLVQTNGYDSGIIVSPSVTALADGGFVITWYTGLPRQVFFQVYKRNGNPYQDPVLVIPANMTEGDNRYAKTTSMSDGGFVVTWSYSGRLSDWEIYANRYDRNGKLVPFVQEENNIREEFEFDEI